LEDREELLSSSLPVRARAGDWVYDGPARRLTRGGKLAAITPKAFDLLGVLLEARPRALSKAELGERLWPGTFVSAASLAQLVTEVRKALGDPARAPRYVRTVQRFGYAFCGEASAQEEGPALSSWLVAWGDREVGLPEGESLIGRGPDVRVRVNAVEVSRHHARLRVGGARLTIEDLRSKNGTFVEGRKIDAPTALRAGNQVVIGPAVLTFSLSSGATATRSVEPARP
jgi:DNA-binding winged helix-turn-helix (wHTH) protein